MNPKRELELKEKSISKLLIEKGMIVDDEPYPGHHWSLVKLSLLGGWALAYTNILKKNWRGKIRYVDLFAGSGTTKIGETKDIVKGSAFAARHYAVKPFDDYILVEKNEARFNALRQNAKLLCNITPPIHGDCNKLIKGLFTDPDCHSLVFVDMEGFDVTWDNMSFLLGTKSDILINFPTSSFERTAGLEKQNALEKFFGSSSWAKASDREEFLQLYMEKLRYTFRQKRQSQNPYVEAIRVGDNRYFYDMILVCKYGGYINVWQYLKERWDRQDPQDVKNLLDHLQKRATMLDDFNN